MQSYRWKALVTLFTFLLAIPVQGEPPLSLKGVGSAEDLAKEVPSKLRELDRIIEAGAEDWGDRIKILKQSAGTLAVIAQALAEHEEETALKSHAPALRNAAIALAGTKTHADAVQALAVLKLAAEGKAEKAEVAYNWAKLGGMDPLMHEMEKRAASFKQSLRKSRDPLVESRHPLVISVLALTTHADTHEVKDPNNIPQWQLYSKELQSAMSAAAVAMKNKNKEEAEKQFLRGMETCDNCHGDFKN